MKIDGITVSQPKTVLVVLRRGETLIPFRFVAADSDDAVFLASNPKPTPPRKFVQKLGQNVDNHEDPQYKKKYQEWASRKEDWMFLNSVKPSNIEWDTVDLSDPTTWSNWRVDLKTSGFNKQEIQSIYNGFLEANIVTEEMLTEARQSFLLSLAERLVAQAQSSEGSEPENSQSGTPAAE